MWEWLQALQGGQANFVGSVTAFAFGLIALIVGALFNAHLNRRRDARLRVEETKSVAAALYGEILLLREQVAYVGRITAATYFDEGLARSSARRFDETFLEQNTLSDPALYPALASKLGMLHPDLVLAITRFHANYREVQFWLPNLLKKDQRPFTYSVTYVLRPAYDAIFEVKPALRKIEALLGIQAPASDPENLGEIATAIAEEEQLFKDATGS